MDALPPFDDAFNMCKQSELSVHVRGVTPAFCAASASRGLHVCTASNSVASITNLNYQKKMCSEQDDEKEGDENVLNEEYGSGVSVVLN